MLNVNTPLFALVAEIFDCGALDIQFLLNKFQIAKYFCPHFSPMDNEVFIESMVNGSLNCNSALYACMEVINRHLYRYAKKYFEDLQADIGWLSLEYDHLQVIINYCKDQLNNLSPFINSIDTRFNNLIDELSFDDLASCKDNFLKLLRTSIKQ